MSQAVGNIRAQEDRMAYVRFELKVIEDTVESQKQGRFVGKTVEYAHTSSPGEANKSVFTQLVQGPGGWLEMNDWNVRNGRMPAEWRDRYLKAYEAWKKGNEMPLHGTPVRGWAVISPERQEQLCRLLILTVEDVAGMSADAMAAVGMGAVDLKNRATAWLAQAEDKGPLAMENAALKSRVEQQEKSLATLEQQVARLTALVPKAKLRAVGSAPDDEGLAEE